MPVEIRRLILTLPESTYQALKRFSEVHGYGQVVPAARALLDERLQWFGFTEDKDDAAE